MSYESRPPGLKARTHLYGPVIWSATATPTDVREKDGESTWKRMT
jgi:hypothetical protein